VVVRAAKPSALVFASSAEVEVRRSQANYPNIFGKALVSPTNSTNAPSSGLPEKLKHVVAIGLGSNLGDRFNNIEQALRLLEDPQLLPPSSGFNVDVIDTSFLYETTPMYVTEQPSFINCACLVS
jgi:dihydroneopterin aldolase / 2-amino-4-hydroxy-6-hydroxymethyldihydropteridine diphosphokinase / dihydropteroate synthase